MRHLLSVVLVVILVAGISLSYVGCKKSESATAPTVAVYNVTATVLNPLGQPQGGATLSLQNPPAQPGVFSALTDSAGKATIQSPAGAQTIVAKMGTVFQATMNINVSSTASNVISTPLQLQQQTSLGKVLVVQAGCEQLEDVLRAIQFTTFDSTTVGALRDSAAADSGRLLTYLRQYALIFSDCDCSSEQGYPVLGRTYGRYVAGGGKIYGGHYNYYNLEFIFPGYYIHYDSQNDPTRDSLKILDPSLASWVGFAVSSWDSSGDSRRLSGYEHFTDLAPGSKTYATIYWTNPQIGVIVENYVGSGKYLWTDYHNQDIKNVAHLTKIVQYFLWNL